MLLSCSLLLRSVGERSAPHCVFSFIFISLITLLCVLLSWRDTFWGLLVTFVFHIPHMGYAPYAYLLPFYFSFLSQSRITVSCIIVVHSQTEMHNDVPVCQSAMRIHTLWPSSVTYQLPLSLLRALVNKLASVYFAHVIEHSCDSSFRLLRRRRLLHSSLPCF